MSDSKLDSTPNPLPQDLAPKAPNTLNATNSIDGDISQAPVEKQESNTAVPGSQYNNIQWFLIAFAVYSSALLYGLDTTIVAVIQGPVIERFNNVEKLGWLGIGFPLGSIATISAWSKGYGSFDTKWMYVASLVNFAAGSALCGGAPDMNGLIVGRVWAGAGGAGMFLGQLNIWSQNTTIDKRPLYISGGGIVWGVGCILGPIVGGAFADSSATWRWAFYINLILFGVFSPVYLIILHSHKPRPNDTLFERLKEIDWLGITLNAAVYTTFVLAFAIGGVSWGWSSGSTIGSIVALCVLIIAFVLQQGFCVLTTEVHRVFPVRFLRSRTFLLLYVLQSCLPTALAIPLYYIPLFFQFTRGETAVTSAVRLLPFVIFNIVCIFLNGALMPKFKYYMPWFVVSSIFNTIGGALFFATLKPTTSAGAIYGYSILIASGTGLAQQAAYSIASIKAPNHVADAIGFLNNAQIGSCVIALTFTALIFQNVGFHNVKIALDGLGFSDDEIRSALGGTKSRVFEEGILEEQIRKAVERGIVEALRWSFFPVLIAGVVGLVAGLGLRRENLFGGGGSEGNGEGEVKEEKDIGTKE